MKIKYTIFILLFFVASAWGIKSWKGMIIEQCTIENSIIGSTNPREAKFGDDANYFEINDDGIASFHGAAKRGLYLRPNINIIPQIAHSKPTVITRGIHVGFSMPTYAANEEVFLYSMVPARWDGESDITVCLAVSISGNEDVGDKFKFQLSWDRINYESVVLDTAIDVEVETTIITGRNTAYSTYRLDFTIDYDLSGHEISAGDLLSWRIRRINASSSEVDNEVIAWVSADYYTVDKILGKCK